MTRVPAVYRIWFTTIDPLLASIGFIGNAFLPHFMLTQFTPSPTRPPATETLMLLDTCAGFYACVVFLSTVLLRLRPTDGTVWRCVQFGILLVDVMILVGMAKTLTVTGRLDVWRDWRSEEWSNVGLTLWVALLRIAFCLGVGVQQQVADPNGHDKLKAVKRA